MEKKLGEIIEAFQHYKFSEALALIDQVLKKNAKQDKNKAQIPPLQLKLIATFRTGCLVNLANHHQAFPLLKQIQQKDSLELVSKQNPFLVLSISQLFGNQNEVDFLRLMEGLIPPAKIEQTMRFYLNAKMFAQLGKLFLKEYMTTKNLGFSLGHVYLEYLDALEKQKMIKYQKDGYYEMNSELKLKLVSMFLDKLTKQIDDERLKYKNQNKKQDEKNNRLKIQCHQIKLKILINQGKSEEAIAIYKSNYENLDDSFRFLRSIYKLKTANNQNAITSFYIQQMSRVFRKNLNMQNYTPLYDYYDEFLSNIIVLINQKEELKLLKFNNQILSHQNMYQFQNKKYWEVLENYAQSLHSQYITLIRENENKENGQQRIKSDYYRICLKGLLLQLIKITHKYTIQMYIFYLEEYCKYFSSYLTYPDEIIEHWSVIVKKQILKQIKQPKNDGDLMKQINHIRMNLSVQQDQINFQKVNHQFTRLIDCYWFGIRQIEKEKKLQKGQRYISDQFITILTDYIRAYLQISKGENEEQITTRVASLLGECVNRSPYNADIKVRYIYFCSFLGHNEEVITQLNSLDIKSVQMETLGYLYLRPLLEYKLQRQQDALLIRMTRSYQQNQRQTSQYALKALKNGTLDRVQEYLSYGRHIRRSYNYQVLLSALYNKSQHDQNSEYYLLRIREALKQAKSQRLSFNCDSRTLRNQIYSQIQFGQFYGVYNSAKILYGQTVLQLHHHSIISSLTSKDISQFNDLEDISSTFKKISQVTVNQLYDFSCFDFVGPALKCNVQKLNRTLELLSLQLQSYKKVISIKASYLQLAQEFHRLISNSALRNNTDQIKLYHKQLLQAIQISQAFFKSLNFRQQIKCLMAIRQVLTDAYQLLSFVKQLINSNKKLKDLKQVAGIVLSPLIEMIFDILTNLNVKQAPKSNLKQIEERDESLIRLLTVQSKEMKRQLAKIQIKI